MRCATAAVTRHIGGIAIVLATVASAQANPLPPELRGLMERCAPMVHPITLSAVIRRESSGNPYAIGVNGGARLVRQPRTRDEAVATAAMLRRKGIDFDSGLGQVNVRNVGWLGVSIEDLFDPCVNLRSAARVLADCYGRATKAGKVGQPAIQAALSCYNTGSLTRGFANGYVASVTEKARTRPTRIEARAVVDGPVAAARLASGDVFVDGIADAFGVAQK